MQTSSARPGIANRAGRAAAAQAEPHARSVNQADPFAGERAPHPANPGPQRARAAVQAAEQPEVTGRPRAAQYAPVGDTLFLRDVEGQELEIWSITATTDQYGDAADILVTIDGDPDSQQVVRASGFAGKRLLQVLEQVEAGNCAYPLLARFDHVAIAGGKSVWQMS